MRKKINTIYLFILFLTALDQLTKYSVTQHLNYSKNTGIAFGFPVPSFMVIVMNIILLFAVVYVAKKELNMKNQMAKIAVAMILAGGFSNLIDRVFRGYVIDFISIWKYPSFNVADIFITLGAIIVIVLYGRIKKKK